MRLLIIAALILGFSHLEAQNRFEVQAGCALRALNYESAYWGHSSSMSVGPQVLEIGFRAQVGNSPMRMTLGLGCSKYSCDNYNGSDPRYNSSIRYSTRNHYEATLIQFMLGPEFQFGQGDYFFTLGLRTLIPFGVNKVRSVASSYTQYSYNPSQPYYRESSTSVLGRSRYKMQMKRGAEITTGVIVKINPAFSIFARISAGVVLTGGLLPTFSSGIGLNYCFNSTSEEQ